MRGFSALEIIIAVSILVFLAAGVTGALNTFRDARELERVAIDVMNMVREAKSRTLASDGDSQFGVYFESGRAVFFRGASYTEGAGENEEYPFASRVEAHSITVPGSVVVFERLTGATDDPGIVSFRLKSSPSKTRALTITAAGLIYGE